MDRTIHLRRQSAALFTSRALALRAKGLFPPAIGISTRCVDRIGLPVQGAITSGATREDVADTIWVAAMVGGEPAYMYAFTGREAFDQLS